MSRRAPIGLLAVAVAASGTLLFSLVSHLTFVGDSWDLLANRPDWTLDTFLQPWNEHPIVLPALIFKVLLALFGMESALPFYVVSVSLFLLCAVLMFVFLRRRVGDWAALGGAVLLLFLGAAYEDLLWEFQMGFFGSIAAGLGSLIALDREDPKGDRIACALLVIATAFSTLGAPFIAAAAARVWLDPTSRRKRAYVPLIPLGAYALWWLASGHAAGGQLGVADIPALPKYVFEVASAGIASLLGRQPIGGNGQPPLLAQVLTVLLVGALGYWIARRQRIPPGLIVALVLISSFLVLIALDRGPQRFSSRFQYPSAVFLLVVAAEVLRGYRLPRPVAAVLVVVTAAAVVGGVSLLHQGYERDWKPTAEQIRSTLAVIDIAGPAAQPGYPISLPPSVFVTVAKYRAAEREHGTPAFSEAQLLGVENSEREIADAAFIAALGIHLHAPLHGRGRRWCRTLDPRPGGDAELRLTRSGSFSLVNHAGKRAIVGLRRFGEIPSYQPGVPKRSAKSLQLPRDRSPRPWWLSVKEAPVKVCALR
ncbi:MAG: hypothetical protein ACTHN3_02645 [Solirubrobacterales bacterium]